MDLDRVEASRRSETQSTTNATIRSCEPQKGQSSGSALAADLAAGDLELPDPAVDPFRHRRRELLVAVGADGVVHERGRFGLGVQGRGG
jgi:hypothetical protein